MELDPQRCYRALAARDPRFDGLFFVGVESTGIYCRPICPARTPARRNCSFYGLAAAAERAGFRACLRCRPELAPGSAHVDARSRLVAEACARIEAGFVDEHGVDALAGVLGVTARHLRRTLEAELGVSPVELARSHRLARAKHLLQDTDSSMATIAFAAGFSSVRRFNACVRERFGVPPSALRRAQGRRRGETELLELRLDYRPPLAWDALVEFWAARAIPGVEQVSAGRYRRVARYLVGSERVAGWLELVHDEGGARPCVRLRLSLELARASMRAVAAARALCDLDAEPAPIAAVLGRDEFLAGAVRGCPGLRVPGCFDRFELVVRAILGQQVSVAAATTLAGRLAERFGAALDGGPAGLMRSFPDVDALARASVAELAAIGLPRRRALAVSSLARAVAAGEIELDARREIVEAKLLALPGVGPWTVAYVAMRAFGWPDALPAGDLVLRRALGLRSARELVARTERWRPWRAYGVILSWRSHHSPDPRAQRS